MKTEKRQGFPVTIKRGSVTVLIYRTPSHGYERFTISYHQDNVRKRSSFSTFKAAKTEAEAVASRLTSTDAAVFKLTGADLSAYQRARQHLDPLDVAIEIAAAEFSDAKKKLGAVPLSQAVQFYLKQHPKNFESHSVQSVADEFIKTKTADGLSERYIQSLRWALPKFTNAFHCAIADVTARDVSDWLRQTGLSARTRNNLRTSVQTLFSFARARQYLPKDHDEIEQVPPAKDRGGKIEILTPTELEEIIGHTSEKLIPFLVISAFAGIRHAEILRLDWKDVRFDDRIIEISAANAKTASRRTVPILDNLRQWLLPYQKVSGSVCPYRNVAVEMHFIAKRINQARRLGWAQANGVSAAELKETERQICGQPKTKKKPGLQKGEVPPGSETAKAEGWAPFFWKHNGLRHSFISYRVAEIKNVAQVALEAGNRKATGKTNPYIGEVLEKGFLMAQAVVVLLTPDDEARLKQEYHKHDEPPHEAQLCGQARPNVLFEAGMAMGLHPNRTVLAEFGQLRPFTDIGGRHLVRLDNSPHCRKELASRLETAGCAINLDGDAWMQAE